MSGASCAQHVHEDDTLGLKARGHAGGLRVRDARKKGALRLEETALPDSPAARQLVRDFHDPYLELLRLLHEASEVEHALMLQYLSAASR